MLVGSGVTTTIFLSASRKKSSVLVAVPAPRSRMTKSASISREFSDEPRLLHVAHIGDADGILRAANELEIADGRGLHELADVFDAAENEIGERARRCFDAEAGVEIRAAEVHVDDNHAFCSASLGTPPCWR